MQPLPPLDTSALHKMSGRLGSNPGGIFEDDQGHRYYVKTLESPAHAQNEYVAAMLYQLAGAPTLTYVPTVAKNQVATAYVQLDKRRVAQLDERERRQAQQWFGVHAWTANWDVAGFNGDNQGVVNGTVVTLDVGGALAFRGQGDPKGHAFGTLVHELQRLRTDPENPDAVKLFGDMDPTTLRQAIQVVTRLGDDSIRQVILSHGGKHRLADKMVARKTDMARQLAEGF